MTKINLATATPAELKALGFSFRKMASVSTRQRPSLWGIKQAANKGMRQIPLNLIAESKLG